VAEMLSPLLWKEVAVAGAPDQTALLALLDGE
jgi:hypothetical protein